MLEYSSLFFARAATLTDPFEARYPNSEYTRRKEIIKKQWEGTDFSNMYKDSRVIESPGTNNTYVSCWHLNQYESPAMWSLYLKSQEGIAIQSTFKRLIESFNQEGERLIIGVVSYIDYENEEMSKPDFAPVFHKRKSFEHEKELRAMFTKYTSKGDNIYPETPVYKFGVNVQVNIETLIDKIYISPLAESWIKDIVTKIIDRYDLSIEVKPSSLYDEPLY